MTVKTHAAGRTRHRLIVLGLAVLGGACSASSAQAVPVVQDTSGTSSSRFQFFWGQSFTTPVGPGWNTISFSFQDSTAMPFAAGTGYLFTSAFAGTPSDLASAGALAVSAPAEGFSYSFAPGFRLAAATQYHFYADAPMRLLGGGTASIGGTSVFAGSGLQPFVSTGGGNANFVVSGVPAAVPEPAGWVMLITGFAWVGGIQRRRTKRLNTATAARLLAS